MDVAKVCTIHNSGLFVVATKLFITGMLLIFVVHLYGAEPVNEQEAERKWEHDERYLAEFSRISTSKRPPLIHNSLGK